MSFQFARTLTKSDIKVVQDVLLGWGGLNYRSFPWRSKKNSAYNVFIAEFLLRKTRAENVHPVYVEFLNRYPNIDKLHRGHKATIEKMLQPLGLQHVRADGLKRIARILKEEFNGKIPNDEIALSNLPHCGRYIANAVLCFHLKEDRPLVDANILRFLCRHFGFEPVVEIHKADHLWDFMKKLQPKGRSREFNYAILDYCALVCTGRECKCEQRIWE